MPTRRRGTVPPICTNTACRRVSRHGMPTERTATEEMVLITQNAKEMQQIMSNYVGIVRSNLRLERALRRLEIIFKENEELYLKSTPTKELCELRNMIDVGYLIIKQAQAMKRSIGLHYSLDYPIEQPVEAALRKSSSEF